MLTTLLGIYTAYILLKIYISTMQIGYVDKAKNETPVLMTPGDYVKAGRYSIAKERLGMIETLIDYALLLLWIGIGLAWLDGWLMPLFEAGSIWLSVTFLLLFLFINQLASLPVQIYTTFVLDKRYGFSNMTPGLFLADLLKGLVMTILFGGIVIAAIVWIIQSYDSWWLYGFGLLFALMIAINALYPTLIAPLFNKFRPLEDAGLMQKIESLLAQVGFKSSGVFIMDASKRDSRLNAYFGGLGSTKRVVLFDTLLSKITHEELLSVLGHELGHFKHHDILKRIALMGILLFSAFYLFSHLPTELFLEIGIAQSPHAVLALFLLLMTPLTMLFMPILSFLSRQAEFKADEFGSKMGSQQALCSALTKLSGENRHFPKSHPLYVFFYYSHPPLLERLEKMGCTQTPTPQST